MRKKEMLVATSARLSPENIQWLKDQGEAQERSANWFLNNLITEARLKSALCKEDSNT